MVSVIIPALNEAGTIQDVVRFAHSSPHVTEVLVVDDGSVDGTPELARAAGARVITSTLLGKGASMADGARAARGRILVYLDGDLRAMHPDLVARMTRPIANDEADFVKAKFTRQAGRVTMLTAKPLLRTFFPELARFEQPLAGIIAARKSLLQQLRFENDYGVDVGLLLDAAGTGARLAEVDIGHVEHESQSLEMLAEMATQVVRTVLDRAARRGRLNPAFMGDVRECERQQQAELALATREDSCGRLALFDMDGVLLHGRFIAELAHRTRKGPALARYLDNFELEPDERTRSIAALFAGIRHEVFEETALDMPLMPGARETVVALRKSGFRVGIVSDSFRFAAETVRRRVFADFSVSHLMKFRGGRATGEVVFAPAMSHPCGCPQHPRCKVNVLHHLTERHGICPNRVLAVGDGENDVCLLRAAGLSVAFRSARAKVRAAARHVVEGALLDVLNIADLDIPPHVVIPA